MRRTGRSLSPKADRTQPPRNPAPGRHGGCWVIVLDTACPVLGLVLGGLHGLREYRAAVDAAVREHGFADYLPVGVPFWAFAGALGGAIVSTLLPSVRRLVSRPSRAKVNEETSEF